MTKAPTHRAKLTIRAWIMIAIIIVIPLAIIIYKVTGFGYTVSRLNCGHKPYVNVASIENASTYMGPTNTGYSYLATGPGNTYYCTEQDARAAGLIKYEYK